MTSIHLIGRRRRPRAPTIDTTPATSAPAPVPGDLPPPPRQLLPPTPPADLDEALDDLARELVLHRAVVRCQREQRSGLSSSRLQPSTPLALPSGWITALARGVVMPLQGREWSAQMVAAHADLPLATWRALRVAAQSWRLARLRKAPESFPLRGLPALEQQLPPLAARVLGVLLLEQAGHEAHQQLTPDTPTCSTVEDWVACMGEERTERRAADLLAIFGPDSAGVQLGVLEPPTAEERASDVRTWEIHLCRGLVADLLGQPIETLAREPGVTVARPSERLTDVVLSEEQRRLVGSIDTGWPTRAGTTNALAVLLHGPSGTGKTLLARALAGERGVPLVLLDGSSRRRRDRGEEEQELAGKIASLVRRAATEHAILFIDEADDVLNEGTDASRALLIALERHPAVVILATNKPLAFDPALDRRLQIKIRMDIPGPVERAAILRRELTRAQIPLADGLLEDGPLDRLAGSASLSGGHWRSVVQVSGMLSGTRGNAAGTPVTIQDLADAVRLQIADEQVVDRSRSTRIRWVDRPRSLDHAAWGPARSERFTQLVDAIDRVRALPRPGRSGIGAVLVIHGPDASLATEAAEGLAAALHLPLARIGQGRASGDHEQDGDLTGKPEVIRGGLSLALLGEGGRRSGRGDRERHAEALHWGERDVEELLHHLGGCSALLLPLEDGEAVEAAMPLLEALVVGPHQAIVHLREGAVSPDLRRLATAVLPWAVVDPAMRRLRWAALGGQGEAPAATATAELAAAATRGQLARAGFVGNAEASELP